MKRIASSSIEFPPNKLQRIDDNHEVILKLPDELLATVIQYTLSETVYITVDIRNNHKDSIKKLIKHCYFYFQNDMTRNRYTLIPRIVLRFMHDLNQKKKIDLLLIAVPSHIQTLIIDTRGITGEDRSNYLENLICRRVPQFYQYLKLKSLEYWADDHAEYLFMINQENADRYHASQDDDESRLYPVIPFYEKLSGFSSVMKPLEDTRPKRLLLNFSHLTAYHCYGSYDFTIELLPYLNNIEKLKIDNLHEITREIIQLPNLRSLIIGLQTQTSLHNLASEETPIKFSPKLYALYIYDKGNKRGVNFSLSEKVAQFVNAIPNLKILSIRNTGVLSTFLETLSTNHTLENIHLEFYQRDHIRQLLSKLGNNIMQLSIYCNFKIISSSSVFNLVKECIGTAIHPNLDCIYVSNKDMKTQSAEVKCFGNVNVKMSYFHEVGSMDAFSGMNSNPSK
jgi:hypothetical protein